MMKKLFRYLLLLLVDSKRLSEAVNTVSTPAELDHYVLKGGDKQ